MSRRFLVPAALAALLAVTPAYAQVSGGAAGGGTAGSGGASAGGAANVGANQPGTANSATGQIGTTDSAGQSAGQPQGQPTTRPQGPLGRGTDTTGQIGSEGQLNSNRAPSSTRSQADALQNQRAGQGRVNTELDESIETRTQTQSDADPLNQGRSRTRARVQADSESDLGTGVEDQFNQGLDEDLQQDNQFDLQSPERQIRNRPSLDVEDQDDQMQDDDAFGDPQRDAQDDNDASRTRGQRFQNDQDRFQDDQDTYRQDDDRFGDDRNRFQDDQRFDDDQRRARDGQFRDQNRRQRDRQLGDRFDREDRQPRFDRDRQQRRENRQDRRADLTERLGVQFDTNSRNNLTIESVERNSVLAEAGIRDGDVLVSVDGRPIRSMNEFTQVLTNVDRGARIPLIVQRDGRQQRIFLSANDLYARGLLGAGVRSGFWETVGLNLAADAGRLVVDSIAPRSFFAGSGLRQGDVIISAYGQRLASPADFQRIFIDADPGTRIPLAVYRDGRQQTIYVTARDFQDGAYAQNAGGSQQYVSGAWLGVTLNPRYTDGAMVRSVERGSPAAQAGVRPGDWIVSVNGREVRSPDHLSQMISQMRPNQTVDLEVSRRSSVQLQASLAPQPDTYVGSEYEGEPASREQRRVYTDDYDTGFSEEGQYSNGIQSETRTRETFRRSQDFEDRSDDRGLFEAGDGDGRILNRDEGGLRGRIFGGDR